MCREPSGTPEKCSPAERVVDLTRTLGPGMSCYPGTPPPDSVPLCTIGEHGFSERQLTFSSHTGTHVDLPLHLFHHGNSLDGFSAEQFIGPAAVIDVSGHCGSLISGDLLRPYAALAERSEFLLIRSGWGRYWGTEAYLSGYPVLDLVAAEWLADFGLKGVGVDMMSVDAADSAALPVHRIFLERNILIIENLDIPEELAGRRFLFCSLPLKLEGAEASPVRAIAIVGQTADLFCNFKR
ncbi:MAG: cyclase family protein [Chlorobium sp.]|uniref:cyclase family protein n=1 Tax=Chlorobium sp. TaxID=1095 RepID=UPI002F3F1811